MLTPPYSPFRSGGQRTPPPEPVLRSGDGTLDLNAAMQSLRQMYPDMDEQSLKAMAIQQTERAETGYNQAMGAAGVPAPAVRPFSQGRKLF